MNDEKKFYDIYNAYWFEIYSYSSNILRDKEAAEDVTQELFLDLWNRLPKLQIENYRHYLLKGCKFQCIKRLRHIKFDYIQLEKVEYALSTLEDDYDGDYIRSILLEQVESTARKILPPKCYKVFWLRYKENLSHHEIALRLGISTNTVESHITKALNLLKKATIYDDVVTIGILVYGMSFFLEC